MQKHFDHLRATRLNILNTIAELSNEQLNKIPAGYNNNIAWNMMHALVTQQILMYRLSNNDVKISKRYMLFFAKGTKAKNNYPSKMIEDAKKMLINSINTLEKDYKKGLFSHYEQYATSFGIKLNTIEDAIVFNTIHESLHLGYIMALKKAI